MARLLSIALLLGLGSSPGWAQSLALPLPEDAPSGPVFSLPDTEPGFDRRGGGGMLAGTEVGSGATFGLGMFGLKREKSEVAPTTVREVNVPKTRRAGLGLSLSF